MGDWSSAVCSSVVVYWVPAVSGPLGVRVAIVQGLLQPTVAATGVALPWAVKVKELLVSVVASICREKVAVGATPVATPVALAAGVLLVTVGGGLAVVNVHV